MRHVPIVFLLLVVGSLACDRRRPPDPRAMVQRAMRGLFIYPGSVTIDMAAGEDAAQVTLTALDSVAVVARWFREALRLNGWSLQSDLTANDHSIAIVATKGARPLWVTLHPNVGGPGTTYTLIGAVVATGDSLRLVDSLK